MIWTIARTEFSRMFTAPLAWTILGALFFLLSLSFFNSVEDYLYFQQQSGGLAMEQGVTDLIVAPFFNIAGWLLLFILPLLTMRLFSEERQNGTLAFLLSAPISLTEIVIGKYLGLVLFLCVSTVLLSLIPLSLLTASSLDIGKFLSGFIGLILLLCSFAAAGLFFSILSRHPVISAILSFSLLVFLLLLFVLGRSSSGGSEVFTYLSHFGHLISFLEGSFDTADLAYYLLFIIAFLVLSIRKLDNERLQR